MSYHKTIVEGNIGKDPELRYAPSGSAVASFSVAVTEKWTDKNSGEKKEHAEWYRCTAFGRTAEIVGQYCSKGSRVLIDGKHRTDKFQDKDTGKDRYSTSLIVNELQLLGNASGGQGQAPQASQQARQAPQSASGARDDFDSGDIPF